MENVLKQCLKINNEEVKKVVEPVYQEYSKLAKSDDKVYIVNAGHMNHGKSSLFNSLMGRFDEFAAEDVRTTVENKEVAWKGNLVLVDTPGLAAQEADNSMAYAAYSKANLIVFVHDVKTGELHSDEVREINTLISYFEQYDKEYFWQHFCFVLSHKEAVQEEDLTNIETDIRQSMQQNCKCQHPENIPVYCVSNTRYQKGITENKQNMVKKSGIPELLQYIDSRQAEWEGDARKLKAQQLDKLCQNLKYGLQKLYDLKNDALDKKRQKVKKNIDKIEMDVYYCKQDYKDMKCRVNSIRADEALMQQQLNNEQAQHQRELANF